MVLVPSEDHQELDMEWVTLIMRARSMGFNQDEVRKIIKVLAESGKDGMEETAV
ncbi:hypothetical protein [Paenibacillus arenilitoris]|uniref:Sin domain-containing protein n=1 Tax=Paenibacillus arenilitoris TaxID=2772299 RepID=A0A927H8F8_9BACL|nr:hypothetical protein [Paenibacillus arenilitoris]MBD2872030.1 hypothetical protein [Paenibacillus arenilitoris]